MQQLPCRKEFAWNKNRSMGNPYTIIFVYPKFGNPFIVKGGKSECITHMYEYPSNAFMMVTEWRGKNITRKTYSYTNGAQRHFTTVKVRLIYNKYKMRWRADDGKWNTKTVRRIPRKWMSELESTKQKTSRPINPIRAEVYPEWTGTRQQNMPRWTGTRQQNMPRWDLSFLEPTTGSIINLEATTT